MDKVERFFELKEEWKCADEQRRSEIDAELDALLQTMTEAEADALADSVEGDFARMHTEVQDIKDMISVREQMQEVLPFLSVSALSHEFFWKSSSWFHQRLNGNLVHGKPAQFNEAELKQLQTALHDIGNKLLAVAF